MSAEFRQRTPGEYAAMFWRRKWMIVLPTLAVTLAVGWVVLKLPNVYESTTLLTVRPASISTNNVERLSNNDLTIRINNIGQEVTSRSSLEPIITRYNLYPLERMRGEPMDVLVERMRTRDLRVTVNTSRDEVINGFFLSFRGPDPRAVQGVTAELASKYVNAQTEAATKDTALTKEFFEEKLLEAKTQLNEIDGRRLRFMMQNSQHLPSVANALVGQLTGLREQQKGLLGSLDMLRQRRSLLNTQLSDIEKQRVQEREGIFEQIGDPKQTLAYAELAKRKAQLESERQQLLAIYKEKHPDVKGKQAEIDSVQREIDLMISEHKARVDDRRRRLEAQIDPRVNTNRYELQATNTQISVLEKQLALTEGQIADINSRLSGMPGTEVGLEAINREYQSAKSVYDTMLEQAEKAKITADVAGRAQGETIAVIDPASLPEQPVAPNRLLLLAVGFFAGLGCGLLLAALFEVPRMLTIQTSEDAEHYTGLPVLATLPHLLTPREERRLKLRRAAFALAGLVVTVLSVPALAFALKFSRIIEMFASRG